jgi:hypothetical protein
MKSFLSSLFFLLLLTNLTSAQSVQIPDHALGLRFGTVYGLGTEISYQHRLTTVNRLELDLGFNSYYEYANNFRYDYNSWGLAGLYHWVWNLEKNFTWYAGPGARIGSYSSNLVYDASYNNGIFLSAAGDIGIEYSFPERIQLALNARPEFGLYNHGSGVNIGFAVRYQFK